MKKRIIGIAIAMCTLGTALTGCSFSTTNTGTTEKENTTAEETTAETTETVETKKTEAEAKEGAQKVFEALLECTRNGDRDGFDKNFIIDENDVEKSKSSIDFMYDFCRGVIDKNYPYYEYYVIGSEGKYYTCGMQNSIVAGEYPDYSSNHIDSFYVISYDEGSWKIDLKEEAAQVNASIINSKHPQDILEAEKAGRNAIDLSNYIDYSWTNSTVTIPKVLDCKAYLMWQNEDGSVEILINVKNGTDEPRSVGYFNIEATDDVLGDIFNVNLDGVIIPAKSAHNYTYKIDASNIITGTQSWNKVYIQTHSMNTK